MQGGDASGTEAPIDLELRITRQWINRLTEGPIGQSQTIEPPDPSDPLGWATLRTRIMWTPMLVEWLLARGDEVEVVRPIELRRVNAQTASKAAALYGGEA